jgi:SAM-dependent methyltransferase
MTDVPHGAKTAPAVARNREPILEVLKRSLPQSGLVLEFASGTGEHAVGFAQGLPHLMWRPTDRDAETLASISAWREAAGATNLLEPLILDAADPDNWPVTSAAAVVAINMIHISPWASCEGLMAGAGRVLSPGGVLFIYGPYREAETPTAPSNEAFDTSLKSRNPEWGLRHLDEVKAEAARNGLAFVERVAMPANNLSVVFRKG